MHFVIHFIVNVRHLNGSTNAEPVKTWKLPSITLTLANHYALTGNMNTMTGQGAQHLTKACMASAQSAHLRENGCWEEEDWHVITIIWELLFNLDEGHWQKRKKMSLVGKTEKIQRGDKEGTGDLPMRFNCASKINCHQESCEGPLFVMRTSEGNCLCTDL